MFSKTYLKNNEEKIYKELYNITQNLPKGARVSFDKKTETLGVRISVFGKDYGKFSIKNGKFFGGFEQVYGFFMRPKIHNLAATRISEVVDLLNDSNYKRVSGIEELTA